MRERCGHEWPITGAEPRRQDRSLLVWSWAKISRGSGPETTDYRRIAAKSGELVPERDQSFDEPMDRPVERNTGDGNQHCERDHTPPRDGPG
jgi:hypothetical protein